MTWTGPPMKPEALARLIAGHVSLHACMAGTRMAAPLLALRDGHSALAVGILLALFSLAQLFLAIPSGRYADRHGLRRPVGLAAVASNATVSYTNSDGVSGRTATLSAIVGSQAPATPVIGTLIWFNLAAGDKGVRSIQSITLGTSWVSGSISLMITRDIATIGTTIPNVTAQKVIGSPGIRLYNGTCLLHCNVASATTATFYSGELTIMEK